MSERQPLLTEEQIQEMLEYAKKEVESGRWTVSNSLEDFASSWLFDNFSDEFHWWKESNSVYAKVMNAGCYPPEVGMDKFLAFLRGQTKRIFNIDRLRKDVKAWVDDPDRKSPEWMMDSDRQGHHWILSSHLENLDRDMLCQESSIIGINPDDYFEEVEVTE